MWDLHRVVCGVLNGALVTQLRMVPVHRHAGTMLSCACGQGDRARTKDRCAINWLNDLLARLPPDRARLLFPPGVWLLFALSFAVAGLLLYTRLGRYFFAWDPTSRRRACAGFRCRGSSSRSTCWAVLHRAGGADAVLATHRRRSDGRHRAGAEHHRRGGHRRREPGRRRRLGSGVHHRRPHHAGDQLGCSQMGWPNWVQEIVTGGIIVAAVALDRLRHRRA